MNNLIKEISKRQTALLIMDTQAKIMNPIKNKDLILENIYKLLKAYEILGENIYLSEQNPPKLGSTVEKLLPKVNFKKFEKMDFSIANNQQLNNELSLKKIKQLIICGFETHICIQQSVLGFLKSNFKVYLAADSMSSRKKIDHDFALKRMESEGAILSTAESIIFELCETSSRIEFKEISNIIKNN
tara:strand:+ start:135 stop:695 length:561 start_codon:yes stop_codon:yes gene_type:complete